MPNCCSRERSMSLAVTCSRTRTTSSIRRQWSASGTAVEKRADGMPIAYITGEKEFWSMPLVIGPETLIPRPDTEVLVEQALCRIPRNASFRILDLGTGSGAVWRSRLPGNGRSVACWRPMCQKPALRIGAENARQLGYTQRRISPERPGSHHLAGEASNSSSATRPTSRLTMNTFTSCASNRPRALVAGPDWSRCHSHLSRPAPGPFLDPGGWLLIEHGEQQADAVAGIC